MKEIDSAIFPPHKAFYFESMIFNSRNAVKSIEYLGEKFSQLNESNYHEMFEILDQKEILNHGQNIIIQCATLSKYFWPIDTKRHNARKWLRDMFSIDDENPLKNREVRNALEHFDEKLDDYLNVEFVGIFIPSYVGPKIVEDGRKIHLFRAYYTDCGIYEVLGRKIDLTPLADEIIRIHVMLEALAK